MSKLTESAIETLAIQQFERLGYAHLHGPDIAPDGTSPERRDYAEVLLQDRLEQAVRRINPALPPDLLHLALKDVQRIQSPDLLANNEAFHRLLTEGVPVSLHKDGDERGERVWLVDFANPANNEFVVSGDDEARSMGLSDFEYAFYTAVANNDSARELMQKDQLRELAVVLTQRVRETPRSTGRSRKTSKRS